MTAAVPVIDRAFETVEPGAIALVLTDADGTVIHRWSGGGKPSRGLGESCSQPGHSLSEASVGTNAVGVVRETGRPILIGGPEHYSESFFSLVCAGCPIFHPITGKLIGILDVTCKRSDSNAVLLPWVSGMATDVQQELLQRVSRTERLLMQEYVRESRGPGQTPVICLNDRTIIATPPAARIVGGVHQAILWEHAARTIGRALNETFELPLAEGESVMIRCRPIQDAGQIIGAVVRILGRPTPHSRPDVRHRPADRRRPADQTGGPGAAWRHAHEELARGTELNVPLLLRGEAGVGKLALARAAYPGRSMTVFDTTTVGAEDFDQWIRGLRDQLGSTDDSPILIRRLNALEPRGRRLVIGLVERRAGTAGPPLILTETLTRDQDAIGSAPAEEFDSFTVVVPPLRDRQEDLPHLLATLSESVSGRPRRWLPDAIQALSRLDWPGNVRELRNVVRKVVAAHPVGDIGTRQLPAGLLAEVPHRNLTRMERLEFNAIVTALRMFDGNKLEAAAYLQISRSTLYRKMRTFGLDLDRSTY